MPRAALRRYFRHGLFPQLMVFEAVARLGSVTKAADALHLAQPTVSLHLRKLSEALELPLFEQRGRQLHLTAAGRELHQLCEELIGLLLRTETRLAVLRAGEASVLRIAVAPGARQVIARMLASFCSRHPGVQASLHVANRAQLMDRLAAGEDHLYVLALREEMSGVKAHVVATESLGFYCRASSALASATNVSLSELASQPFIVRESGSGTRTLLQGLLHQAGYELRIRAELASDEAVAEAASVGLGVAFLPISTAAPFIAAGSLVGIQTNTGQIQRDWCLVHRDEKGALPAAALLFIKEAKSERAVELDLPPVGEQGAGNLESGLARGLAHPTSNERPAGNGDIPRRN